MIDQQFTTEELTNEIWKPVPGLEGIYAASNLGRIRVECARPKLGIRAGHILKQALKKSGRYSVALWKDGKSHHFRVHQIIARAFLGPRPRDKVTCHKNDIKTDNRSDNLEYLTQEENRRSSTERKLQPSGDQHYARMRPELLARGDRHWARSRPELVKRGSKHPNAQLTEHQVNSIRRIYATESISQSKLAEQFHVSQVTVWRVLRSHTWKHIQ
jgi:hypothetical protein